MRIECPYCKRILENVPDDFEPRPFCCTRCKLADLDNWFNEVYRYSTPMDDENEGELPN